MGMVTSQITSLTIVYSAVYSDADQRKHQSSASLTFVRGIHSPHKWPVTRKTFTFDDVIMEKRCPWSYHPTSWLDWCSQMSWRYCGVSDGYCYEPGYWNDRITRDSNTLPCRILVFSVSNMCRMIVAVCFWMSRIQGYGYLYGPLSNRDHLNRYWV